MPGMVCRIPLRVKHGMDTTLCQVGCAEPLFHHNEEQAGHYPRPGEGVRAKGILSKDPPSRTSGIAEQLFLNTASNFFWGVGGGW